MVCPITQGNHKQMQKQFDWLMGNSKTTTPADDQNLDNLLTLCTGMVKHFHTAYSIEINFSYYIRVRLLQELFQFQFALALYPISRFVNEYFTVSKPDVTPEIRPVKEIQKAVVCLLIRLH